MATTISGTAGVTFPAGGVGNPAGAVVGTTDTQTLTNKTIQGGAITSGTAVASTSGTSIDFNSIPSWVKRVTVMFNGVSTNGTSNLMIQIGSSSISTSGYVSSGWTTNTSNANSTAGLLVTGTNTAAFSVSGIAQICLLSSNTWSFSASTSSQATSAISIGAGLSPALGGTLDRVRITTVGGTDTFDAGTINILYEG